MRQVTRATRQAADLRLVLSVDLGSGGRRSYSDRAMTTPEGMVILPGMDEPEWAAELDGSSQGAAIRIVSPETWAELTAGLSGAAGKLSLWAEGTAWSTREDLLAGYLDAPVYGSEEEEIVTSLSVATWEDAALIPRPSWQISASTWPRTGSALACPADLYGAYYPVVLGSPGSQRTTAEDLDWYPIPALLVEVSDAVDPPDNSAVDCVVLLGYGRLECVGGTVELYNENTGAGAVVSATATTDALGTPVTIATVAAADMLIVLGDSLWWRPVAGTACGIPGTAKLGSALRWLASWSSVPMDPAGWSCVNDMDRFVFGAIINEPVAPLGWIIDGPLKLLPASLVEGAEGVGIVLRPLSPTRAEADALDLEAVGGWREDPVQRRSWTELRPGLVLEYAPDVRQGIKRRKLTFDPTIWKPTAEVSDTARGRAVAARYPSRRLAVEQVSADWLCDGATALQLATFLHRELTEEWEDLAVVLPQGMRLEAGQLLLLTVADLGTRWTSRLCYVRSAPRVSGPAKYLVRTIEENY